MIKNNLKKKLNMKISKKLNKTILFKLVIIFVSIFVIYLGFNLIDKEKHESEIRISDNNPSWNTYVNTEYGFSIDFPANWKVYEEFEKVSPTINIYIPRNDIKPPFDHFADVNNVSIYPKGLSTEAVIGQYEESDIDINFESDRALNYILEDGSVWATYVSFDDLNDPWKPWGFIWSKVVIENLDYKCLRSDEEIDLEECNPFENDEFVRAGVVDEDLRETQEKILESFKFIEE